MLNVRVAGAASSLFPELYCKKVAMENIVQRGAELDLEAQWLVFILI